MYTPTLLPGPAHPMDRLAAGEARRLGRRGGDLTVIAGAVWLTRRSDPGDHVLAAGRRVRLGANDDAVIEAWDAGTGASVRWQPHGSTTFVQAVLGEPLRGVAFLARRLALACAALARGAARAHARLGGLSS